jgi:putative nucleotidyltransferase with HDIG domain
MIELDHIFSEFRLISDPVLMQKAILCWKDGLSIGGWNEDDLNLIPFTLLIQDCTITLKTHVQAVTQTAIACAQIQAQFYSEKYKLNLDHIIAGALLHDVGKLLEYSREGNKFVKSTAGKLIRHPFSGVGLAVKHKLPDGVIHIIATHAKEGDEGYRSPESIIVHYADFINFELLKII